MNRPVKKTLALLLGSVALVGCSQGGSGSSGGQSIAGSTSGSSTQPAVAMDVKLTSPATTVAVGDPVTVRLEVTGVKNLYGAGCDLAYDPALLQLVSATDGGFVPNATAAAGLAGGKAGVVTLGASAEGRAQGGSGSGTVIEVHFEALAVGKVNLTVADLVLEQANGAPGKSTVAPLDITIR